MIENPENKNYIPFTTPISEYLTFGSRDLAICQKFNLTSKLHILDGVLTSDEREINPLIEL